MATPGQWNTSAVQTDIFIRKGPGQPWEVLDIDATMDAPSGGGQGVESRFGRGLFGGLEYRGSSITGNPDRVTTQVSMRLKSITFLDQKLRTCFHDVMAVQRCGVVGIPTNGTERIILLDGYATGRAPSEGLAMGTEQNEADIMETYDMSAGLDVRVKLLQHQDITKTWSDFAINDVYIADVIQCEGDCGAESDGTQVVWMVTDQDTTPGYSGTATPVFLWSLDGGITFSATYISVLGNGDATSVIRLGNNIVIGTLTKGVAVARIEDVYNGVSNPWTLASGYTLPATPGYLAAVSNTTAYGVGNGGYVFKTTDSGKTWSTLSAGTVTTENLSSISAANENLIWAAGENTTVLKIFKDTISIVLVRTSAGASIMSATEDINVIKAAPGRNHVHIGTNGGKNIRTTNSTATKTVWENLAGPKFGTGQIKAFAFAGYKGDVLFIIQLDANGVGRVLRDISGGYGTDNQIEIIGDFTTPSNNGFNAIAAPNENVAYVGGESEGSYGYVGKLTGI